METCVLIPQEFALAVAANNESKISVWTTTDIAQGSLFYPFQGTIRLDKLDAPVYLDENDVRYRFGLYDELFYTCEKRIRYCNWVRFLKVSKLYDSNVNMVCTKVKGEPIYEVIKPIAAQQELFTFFLPERPEELLFVQLRTSFYRHTMDLIMQDTPLDLSISLMHNAANLPLSSISSSEDEQKSVLSDSTGSTLSLNDNLNENFLNIFTEIKANYNFNKKSDNSKKNADIYKMSQRKIRNVRNERALLPCDVCGKAFDRPSLLKRHMRTHTGEKPHVCMICGKGFSTSSSLNTHKRIHSGEKPHECQVCGKRFTASSNLYYHRMTHIKEKPHKCNLCAKSFPTPGDLKSHLYVHSGSWPFKCQICFRGFSKQTNLRNHLFLHTGNKPHGCELCNKKFALACNLRAHMKTHDGDLLEECIRCSKVFATTRNSMPHGVVCSLCFDSTNSTDGDTNIAGNDDKTDFHTEREITTEDEYSNATDYSDK